MPTTIAITGKGGCGKTTVSALTLRLLLDRGMTPVLAVDADPNLNLNAALGVESTHQPSIILNAIRQIRIY